MDVSNYIQVLGGTLIGAFVSLISSLISNIFSERRFKKELLYREKEQQLRILSPLSEKRVKALEDLYDLIQIIIENEKVNLNDYNLLRKKILYIEQNKRESLILTLRKFVNNQNKDHDKGILIEELKKIQFYIENELGLNIIRSNLIINNK